MIGQFSYRGEQANDILEQNVEMLSEIHLSLIVNFITVMITMFFLLLKPTIRYSLNMVVIVNNNIIYFDILKT